MRKVKEREMSNLSQPPTVRQAVGLAAAFRIWPELPLSAQNLSTGFPGAVYLLSPHGLLITG